MQDPNMDYLWNHITNLTDKLNDVMLQNYKLIHENEELKREIGTRLRDDDGSQSNLDGDNAGS
jgi:regulator of replication initiation timing